jgi:hypothetical protein
MYFTTLLPTGLAARFKRVSMVRSFTGWRVRLCSTTTQRF